MSKFLLLSGAGDGCGLALRLRQEGNDVAVWIREARSKQNFDGLLMKVKRWEEFLDDDTIVLFDSTGGGTTAERLKSRGHFVFAGGDFADQLEQDRGLALSLCEEAGIKVPHSETFHSWDKAKVYIKERDARLVFKPSGELGKAISSYVAYDAQDMLEMMDVFEEEAEGKKPEFELQDFKKGVAISTEGWFNGREFMRPFNHTLERKQIMADNLGPSGGCAGNIVWTFGTDRVLEEGLMLIAPVLEHHEYKGPIDLNTVVNDDGVWALEFTPRFGYDALPALLEMFEGSVSDTIASIARGEYPTILQLKSGFGAGLRMSIPPYPSERFHPDEGIPIRGFVRTDRPHLYFYDVMFTEQGRLVSTAAYGAIAVATAYADEYPAAMAACEALADRARIPDKQYREDLTAEFAKDISALGGSISIPLNREDLGKVENTEVLPVESEPGTGVPVEENDVT